MFVNRKCTEVGPVFFLETALNIHEKGFQRPTTITDCNKWKKETSCSFKQRRIFLEKKNSFNRAVLSLKLLVTYLRFSYLLIFVSLCPNLFYSVHFASPAKTIKKRKSNLTFWVYSQYNIYSVKVRTYNNHCFVLLWFSYRDCSHNKLLHIHRR